MAQRGAAWPVQDHGFGAHLAHLETLVLYNGQGRQRHLNGTAIRLSLHELLRGQNTAS